MFTLTQPRPFGGLRRARTISRGGGVEISTTLRLSRPSSHLRTSVYRIPLFGGSSGRRPPEGGPARRATTAGEHRARLRPYPRGASALSEFSGEVSAP